MMRRRAPRRRAAIGLVVLASTAALLLPSSPAFGSTPGLRILDLPGDANGVNSQGEYGFELGQPTAPLQIPEADIVEVELRPSRGAYLLTFRTSAPAATGYVYGITAELAGCRIFIRQERASDGSRTIVDGCGFDGEVVGTRDRVRGNTLSIGLPGPLGDHFLTGSRRRAETMLLAGEAGGRAISPVFVDTASPD